MNNDYREFLARVALVEPFGIVDHSFAEYTLAVPRMPKELQVRWLAMARQYTEEIVRPFNEPMADSQQQLIAHVEKVANE